MKCRAKSLKTGKWVSGYYAKCEESGNSYIITEFFETINVNQLETVFSELVDEKTIGQFTGLKDKNGKELYFNYKVKLDGNDKIWDVRKDDFGIPLFVYEDLDILSFEEYFLNMGAKRNGFVIETGDSSAKC